MSDNSNLPPEEGSSAFSRRVGQQANRKLRASPLRSQGIWKGIGMFGLVGWSIAFPTLIGTLIGAFLDRHWASHHSLTLTLLFVGLFIGCWDAWRWVAQQDKEMNTEEKPKDE